MQRILNKFKLGASFARFGATLRSKVLLFLLPWINLSRKYFGVSPRFSIMFRFKALRTRMYLEGTHEEIAQIKEIFVDECYKLDVPPDSIRSVVDLGGNIGFSTIYFAACFPHSRVVVCEPDPNNFAKLLENTKEIPSIEPLRYAVGGSDHEAELHIVSGRSMSSSLMERNGEVSTIPVTVKSLDSLLQELHLDSVDILKFDIEGAEYEMLRSANLSKYAYMLGELHYDLAGKDIDDFKRLLAPYYKEPDFKSLKRSRALFHATSKTRAK